MFPFLIKMILQFQSSNGRLEIDVRVFGQMMESGEFLINNNFLNIKI